MKLKVFATLGVAAALVLPFGITTANAETVTTTTVSSVVEPAVVASSDAVLVQDSPVVTTVAAPVPEPVVQTQTPTIAPAPEPAPAVAPAPVVVTEPVTTTTAAAPAPTETAAPATVAAVQAPAPEVIAENPLCTEQYLFTVTTAGDCSAAPVGYTVAQLRADARFELNSRNPLETAEQSTLDAFEANYLGSGNRDKPGVHIIHSASIPGVVYYFGG